MALSIVAPDNSVLDHVSVGFGAIHAAPNPWQEGPVLALAWTHSREKADSMRTPTARSCVSRRG